MGFEEKFQKLSEQFSSLQAMNAKVIAENLYLKNENKKLKQRIIELEDKLGLNSSNSNLPTSKEIYKIEKHFKRKSHRKAGGQAGHKFNGYEMKIPDEIIELEPNLESCQCGGKLELLDIVSRHQKIELPVIKPIVTEYCLKQKQCIACHKKYKAKLENKQLLGSHATNIISVLTGFFNNSKREVQEILSQIFNLDISLGLISSSEGRLSKGLEAKYEDLKNQALNSDYLHMDETSHCQKGKLGWCWLAANKEVSVFKLDGSRGRKVLDKFMPDYNGWLISDRYCVYNNHDEKKRQICLAHLRRDFKRFAHSRNKDLRVLGKVLLEEIDKVFAINNAYKDKKIERLYFLRQIMRSQNRMMVFLQKIRKLPDSEQARRVAENVIKSFEMMWLFTKHDKIELTNNFAERQIKHHVKYRKNSYFTWSDRGDRFLERVKSIYATAKLQKLNPFDFLVSSLT